MPLHSNICTLERSALSTLNYLFQTIHTQNICQQIKQFVSKHTQNMA